MPPDRISDFKIEIITGGQVIIVGTVFLV